MKYLGLKEMKYELRYFILRDLVTVYGKVCVLNVMNFMFKWFGLVPQVWKKSIQNFGEEISSGWKTNKKKNWRIRLR